MCLVYVEHPVRAPPVLHREHRFQSTWSTLARMLVRFAAPSVLLLLIVPIVVNALELVSTVGHARDSFHSKAVPILYQLAQLAHALSELIAVGKHKYLAQADKLVLDSMPVISKEELAKRSPNVA